MNLHDSTSFCSSVYTLAPFGSFFEVAIALNLGFSFLPRLRNAGKRSLDEVIDRFKEKWGDAGKEPELTDVNSIRDKVDRAIKDLNDFASSHHSRSEAIAYLMRWWGGAAGSVLIVTLLYTGYVPAWTMGQCSLAAFLLFAVAPVPLTAAYLILRRVGGRVSLEAKSAEKEADLMTYRKAYGDVLKDLKTGGS